MANPDQAPGGPTDPRSAGAVPVPARSLPVRATPRLRRWLKVLGLTLLGLEAVYLLAANLFLNLWFGVLFEGTNSINMTIGRAWTLWPGDVQVRRVRVVFQDHNLQWTLDVASARIGLKLLPLVRQTFHATSVVGEGAVFRMRHRVDPASVDEPSVAAVPQIPEFPGPAVFEAYVPEPPITDEEYNLWTVHFENVDMGLREAWVQQFRYVGQGRARGAFRLKAARSLWVGPATLELEPGRLTAGPSLITPGLAGRIECTIHPFDVRKPKGTAVFRYFTVGLDLRGPELDLSLIHLFRPHDPLELHRGGGEFRLKARTDHGVLTPGSRLEVVQSDFRVTHPQLAAELPQVKLVFLAKPERGEASLELTGGTVHLGGASAPPLVLEAVRASASSSSVDIAADWQLTGLGLEEIRARAPDVRAFAVALAPAGLRALGGGATWSGHATYRDQVFEGEMRAAFEKVRVGAGKNELELDGRAVMRASGASLETKSGSLSGELEDARLKFSSGASSTFEAGGLRLEASAEARNGSGQGRVRARLSSIRARAGKLRFVTHGELNATLDDWDLENGAARSSLRGNLRELVMSMPESKLLVRAERVVLKSLTQTAPKPSERSSVPARLAFDALLSRVHVQQGAEDEALTGLAEELSVNAALTSRPSGTLDALVRSKARGVEAHYDQFRLQGSPEFEFELTDFDSERNLGRVRADLTVFGFSANDPDGDAQCPWSSVDKATVHAQTDLRGKAGVRVALDGAIERARLAWGDFGTRFVKAELQSTYEAAAFGEWGVLDAKVAVQDARFVSGQKAPSGWDAQIPKLNVETKLERSGSTLTGPLLVKAQQVDARLGRTRFRTHVDADVGRAQVDFNNGHVTAGAGLVRVHDLDLAVRDEHVENWWAHIALDSLDFWTKETLEGSAHFRAKLRDGLPALTVLASQGDLPGFVPEIFPLRDVEAQGSVRRSCRLTDFKVSEVTGGPFVAKGRLQSVPDSVSGAFLVRLAAAEPIAAGLRFNADDSGVTLFAGDGWLKEQSTPLERTARETAEAVCVPPPRECGN